MRLTKTTIENLPLEEKQYFCFDDTLKGFGIKVNPAGSRVFILNYRAKGRTKRFTIGKFGAITANQAREQAKVLLGEIAKGMDPQEEKKLSKMRGRTFSDLSERYSETHAKNNKAQTISANQYFLDHILSPRLGSVELTNISRDVLEDIIFKFKNSTSKETNMPMSGARANRLIALTSKIFNLAEEWGWVEKSPARGLKKFKESKRERIATDEELQRLYQAVLEEKNIHYRNYFLLLFHTMARRSEIQEMKWEDLDLEEGVFKMKDSKANRPFTIPLGSTAIEIIKSTPRIIGNPYVFAGGAARKPINGIGKKWGQVRKRAGVEDLWLHDIRRTGGSNMIMDGASLQDVAQLLNHSNLSTTQRYAQLAQDHKKKKMNQHEDRLLRIIDKSSRV